MYNKNRSPHNCSRKKNQCDWEGFEDYAEVEDHSLKETIAIPKEEKLKELTIPKIQSQRSNTSQQPKPTESVDLTKDIDDQPLNIKAQKILCQRPVVKLQIKKPNNKKINIEKSQRIPIFQQSNELYPIRGKIVYRGFCARNSYQLFKHLSEAQYRENRWTKFRTGDLQFNSSFESGNLNIAAKVSDNQYDLYMRADTNTCGHRQWFYFQIKNKIKGSIKFNIFRFKKRYSLFQRSMKPYVKSAKFGNYWRPGGRNITYQREQYQQKMIESGSSYFLSFVYDFQSIDDEVYFAACIPYSFTYLEERISLLDDRAKLTPKLNFYRQKLTKSLCGLEVPLLTICLKSALMKNIFKKKRFIIINARTHPGQTSSSWVLDGILDSLVRDESIIQWMEKQNIIFKIVPILNPDGVFAGNYRTGIAGQDFNRKFFTSRSYEHPQVHALRNLVSYCKRNGSVQLFLDLHGHSVLKNSFIFGPMAFFQYPLRYLPYVLDKSSTYFSINSSKFRFNQSKIQTARLYFQNKQNILSLTCENSLGLYAPRSLQEDKLVFDKKTSSQFSSNDWRNFGQDLLEGIKSLIGIGSAQIIKSFHYVQEEVLQLQRQKLRQKQGSRFSIKERENTLQPNQQKKNSFPQYTNRYKTEKSNSPQTQSYFKPDITYKKVSINAFNRSYQSSEFKISKAIKKTNTQQNIINQNNRSLIKLQRVFSDESAQLGTIGRSRTFQAQLIGQQSQVLPNLNKKIEQVKKKKHIIQDYYQQQQIDNNFSDRYSQLSMSNDSDGSSQDLNALDRKALNRQLQLIRSKKNEESSKQLNKQANNFKEYIFKSNEFQNRKNFHLTPHIKKNYNQPSNLKNQYLMRRQLFLHKTIKKQNLGPQLQMGIIQNSNKISAQKTTMEYRNFELSKLKFNNN